MPRRNNHPKTARQQSSIDGCHGKKRYPTRDKAEAVIADRSNLIDDDLELDVYRCPSCQNWHLTSVK